MVPEVSIILPVWNGAARVSIAVRSVLRQTSGAWELLVVDDGSTDETARIVAEFAKEDRRIRLLRNDRNLGIQKSLNQGLKEARGIYVARIDDDDEWTDPQKLQAQIAFLDAHPDYVLVGTGAVVVDAGGRELVRYLFPETDEAIRRRMLVKNCFIHSSVLFRAAAARAAGGYAEDGKARHVEDYDLWLRLGARGKLANLPLYAVRFMLRPGAVSTEHKVEQFRKNLALIREHRGKYPHYWMGVVVGTLRLAAYRCFRLLPVQFRSTIFRFYKAW